MGLATLSFAILVSRSLIHGLDVVDRRSATTHILTGGARGVVAAWLWTNIDRAVVANAATAIDCTSNRKENGLAARLAKRDPKELCNRMFSLPPQSQQYPTWMVGDWRVSSNFNGYIFPSTIPRERLTSNIVVPGFQKCSIAATADVGKDNVSYGFRIDPSTYLEDRRFNFQQSIDAYLGYHAVNDVIYDGKENPNRISIDFVDYKTVNAERIELFANARESECDQDTFVCSEYMRQVTFGTGQTYGVPRQVVTNYALYWTWQRLDDGTLRGNLLTAGYLDPQDAMYFEEPSGPVTVYSHVLSAIQA